MPSTDHPTHESVLQALHAGIDIPEEIYQEIVAKYQSLGGWLDRDGSSIKQYDPFVAPQGSVLLGAANRPIGDNDEYDVDLICRLMTAKREITQKALKASVGREVLAYATAHSMKHKPEDKRRCWTLKHADDRRFHMDVLPCVPDADCYRKRLIEGGHRAIADNVAITDQAIAITDKTHPNYERLNSDWPTSNPLGYAAWFREQMAERLLIQKLELMERVDIYSKIEDIPNHKVKTTLQKAIQLLKRHRDTMFADDPEHKPISIIITTLSALAYGNEGTLVGALAVILQRMDEFIENRRGITWVSNPVNPEENFADKWVEEPTKEERFYRWLTAARRDFGAYLNGSRPEHVPPALAKRLDSGLVEKVVDAIRPATKIAAPAIVTGATPSRTDDMVRQVRERGMETSAWCAETD